MENDFKIFKDKINPDEYNGATLIGLNGISVKSHGMQIHMLSLALLISVMILSNNDLNKKIIDNFKYLKIMSTQNNYTFNIADSLHNEFGLTKDCIELVNDIIDVIIDGLLNNGHVKIHNFGSFKVKDKKSRIGRNPKTKEDVIIKVQAKLLLLNLVRILLNI